MRGKLSTSLIATLLAGLVLAAPGAASVALQGQRLAAQPQRATTASSLIAPATACPGQNDLDSPAESQEGAMRCMTEFARARAGLGGLTDQAALDRSASAKADDILRCDSFSHFACDREFTYWMRESGYTSVPCWRVGENLAWGTGEQGTVRLIFRAWMASPTHRENILGQFSELGLDVEVGTLAGQAGIRVWTQHFGTQC